MKFEQGHMRPGRVLSVEDEIGTIKACCPGLFSDQDDPNLLPPIYPLHLSHANSFTNPCEDDEVWVLFFDDNPRELFWIRKDNYQENLKDILSKKSDVIEVVACREVGAEFSQLFFTSDDGWVIYHGGSKIQLRADGSILLDAGSSHRIIDVCDESISLGSEKSSAEPAVLGNKLTQCLNNLDLVLTAIKAAASANPYTAAIGDAIGDTQDSFSKSIETITSQHVTLD